MNIGSFFNLDFPKDTLVFLGTPIIRWQPLCILICMKSVKVMFQGTIRNDYFFAQHNIATLEQCCNHLNQCRNNVATTWINVATMLQRCVTLKIVDANRPLKHHLKPHIIWLIATWHLTETDLAFPSSQKSRLQRQDKWNPRWQKASRCRMFRRQCFYHDTDHCLTKAQISPWKLTKI